MKQAPRRVACLLVALALTLSAALALTPQELGEVMKNEYIGQIPDRVWQETTVEGMLQALGDPYSHYYGPGAYDGFLERANGQSQGMANHYRQSEGVGVITLNHFGEAQETREWVVRTDSAVSHWIVDLRGNRGGQLKGAAETAGIFAGSGPLAYIQDRAGTLYAARSEEGQVTMDPVIVLIGGNTASAGELYAAAIRDRQVGLLIGGRTYGKGVVQTAFDKDHETYGPLFADGSGLLLSTERAFSDSMVSNNILGVLPHLLVEEGQEEGVARLLCADAPEGNTAGYLRIHLAYWRWYVETDKADGASLAALLEALPPQAELYQGTGGDSWRRTTAQRYGADHVPGYRARSFPDVASSDHADAINALKTYGILKGDEAGLYHPWEGLTRASLCALLAQAMHYPAGEGAPAFADTPAGEWYTPYVTTLSALGIVNGCGDGLFHPEDPISHQQFMTILARVAATLNCSADAALKTGPSEETLAGGNYAAYDPWAVAGAWLLDGRWHADAKDIDPHAVTTREEAACDLWTMLSSFGILPS